MKNNSNKKMTAKILMISALTMKNMTILSWITGPNMESFLELNLKKHHNQRHNQSFNLNKLWVNNHKNSKIFKLSPNNRNLRKKNKQRFLKRFPDLSSKKWKKDLRNSYDLLTNDTKPFFCWDSEYHSIFSTFLNLFFKKSISYSQSSNLWLNLLTIGPFGRSNAIISSNSYSEIVSWSI